jgi:hypothetical protein
MIMLPLRWSTRYAVPARVGSGRLAGVVRLRERAPPTQGVRLMLVRRVIVRNIEDLLSATGGNRDSRLDRGRRSHAHLREFSQRHPRLWHVVERQAHPRRASGRQGRPCLRRVRPSGRPAPRWQGKGGRCQIRGLARVRRHQRGQVGPAGRRGGAWLEHRPSPSDRVRPVAARRTAREPPGRATQAGCGCAPARDAATAGSGRRKSPGSRRLVGVRTRAVGTGTFPRSRAPAEPRPTSRGVALGRSESDARDGSSFGPFRPRSGCPRRST